MITSKRSILILGGGGALGVAVRQHLARCALNWDVHIWDRKALPLLNSRAHASAVQQFEQTLRPWLMQYRPNVVFNFAVAGGQGQLEAQAINVDLPVWLADASAEMDFRLVHTSSVMVFDSSHQGPYRLDSQATASEGYGLQKKQAEDGVMARADIPKSHITVARLGWQIGPDPTQNTMRRFLENQAIQNAGRIRASTLWIPSCSRLEHTAGMLWELVHREPGLYQIEGNPGLSFADIVTELRSEYGDRPWTIERTEDFVYNQRMIDHRIDMPMLFPTS